MKSIPVVAAIVLSSCAGTTYGNDYVESSIDNTWSYDTQRIPDSTVLRRWRNSGWYEYSTFGRLNDASGEAEPVWVHTDASNRVYVYWPALGQAEYLGDLGAAVGSRFDVDDDVCVGGIARITARNESITTGVGTFSDTVGLQCGDDKLIEFAKGVGVIGVTSSCSPGTFGGLFCTSAYLDFALVDGQSYSPGPTNTAPAVTIVNPSVAVGVDEGDPVSFQGSANDAEDGDLSSGLRWISSVEGTLGTGAALTVASLSEGNHTITASVSDSAGLSATASVLVTVIAATPGGSLPVHASGSVVQGEWVHYGPYTISGGALRVVMTGDGDADLFVNRGSRPSGTTEAARNSYDCVPWKDTSNESCDIAAAGEYYVSVRGYSAASSYELTVTKEAVAAPVNLALSASTSIAGDGERITDSRFPKENLNDGTAAPWRTVSLYSGQSVHAYLMWSRAQTVNSVRIEWSGADYPFEFDLFSHHEGVWKHHGRHAANGTDNVVDVGGEPAESIVIHNMVRTGRCNGDCYIGIEEVSVY